MTKRTHHSAGKAAAPSIARSAPREEVSRIIRITPMLASLEQAEEQPFQVRADPWAAFAVVVLASSATLLAATWLLERWQLS
jgi:hypothetical protein